MPTCSIIVKRGDLERYEQLYKTFGQRTPVMWDRRRRQRRASAAPTDSPAHTDERRRAERRGHAAASWRSLGFVVVDG